MSDEQAADQAADKASRDQALSAEGRFTVPCEGYMLSQSDRAERASIAALGRHHPDSEETVERRRAFKARRLEEYIQRVVTEAPPLTTEQRDRLAVLLQSGDVKPESRLSSPASRVEGGSAA